MIQEITVSTHSRTEFIDITEQIEKLIKKGKIESGICFIFCPHTTAGLTINENADPSVQRDILNELNKVIPFEDNYKHTEGNAAAHIKSTITGSSLTIPIENGNLALGTWQGIYFCEFDGPRRRKVKINLVSSY